MQETKILCCAVENLKLTPFTAGHHCNFTCFFFQCKTLFFHLLYMELQRLKKIKNLPSPVEIASQ